MISERIKELKKQKGAVILAHYYTSAEVQAVADFLGDSLALSAYPIGEEDPIPGKLHAVDTKTNGIVIRKLEPCKGGYKAIAPNRENYPDMVILKKNITRIYRVTFLCRVL